MDTPHLIAVTGGIGAGKSVVSKMLRAMGYPVYDCDTRAKELMDSSPEIKAAIAARISPEVIGSDQSIDQPLLASIVFAEPEKLAALNSIVHNAVIADLDAWARDLRLAFVETAILYQSGLDRMVDQVWQVEAPRQIRIERVMHRNCISESQVMARINSQDDFRPSRLHPVIHTLDNDGFRPLLPRIESLLSACLAI